MRAREIGCYAIARQQLFFFKQKTAYEIGTGDWSSDVCSSDLLVVLDIFQSWIEMTIGLAYMSSALIGGVMYEVSQIGRASCRERV